MSRLSQGAAGSRKRLAAAMCAAFFVTPVVAQQAPDAGQLLQQQPRPATPAPVLPAPITPADVLPDDETAPRIQVSGFRILGAVLIGEAELQAQLAPLVGQALTMRELQGAALRITAYYADQGYLARVIIPPQEVVDGLVTLQIVEGKRGAYHFTTEDESLKARLSGFLGQRLSDDSTHLDLRQLGEAMQIMNEQPGLSVASSLRPGDGEGVVDLLINAQTRQYAEFQLSANNHGSRATGEGQFSAGLTVHNPAGIFDQLSVLGNFADGAAFGRIDYSLPLGTSGLRMGVNGSHLDYELVQDTFLALEAHGTARTLGASLSYPLTRQFDRQLTLSLALDDKRMRDATVAGETSNRALTAATLGLNALFIGQPDNWLGRSVLNTTLALTTGDSEQRNESAAASDALTRRSQGRYTKLAYSLTHLYPISANWSLNTALRGQFADQNLDSSERMSLGGPTGVRAYPVGEGSGDEAWLLNLNLAWQFTQQATATLFVDAGGVRRNLTTWSGWQDGIANRYELSGAGMALDWRMLDQLLLSASVAVPLDDNPARDANDHNSDGRDHDRARGWLNLSAQF